MGDALKCDVCGARAKIRPARHVIGKRAPVGDMLIMCTSRGCRARVGTHCGTNVPLGTMAREPLRHLRQQAHKAFDPMWKDGRMTRPEAYKWLAESLGISESAAHIALFDEEQCREVIAATMAPLKRLEKMKHTPGVVYAAGWLCHEAGEISLAAGLLDSAAIMTAKDALHGGATPYDTSCAFKAFALLQEDPHAMEQPKVTPAADNHSSVVGGSSAARVLACPGSVGLCAQVPDSPSSPFAEAGTARHDAVGFILTSDVIEKDEDVIGMTFNDHQITQEIFDDDILYCIEAFEGAIGPDDDFLVEQSMPFPGIEDAFGTADIVGPNRVMDWKFGHGVPVYARDNKQLMFYAVCAMHGEATKHMFGEDPDTVITLQIVQPPKDTNDEWTITRKELEAFAYELRQAVKEARSDHPKFALGDHCKWCDAKPFCPLMHGTVEKAASVRVAEHLELDSLPEDINRWLKMVPLLKEWCKGVESLAHAEMEKGMKLEDYELDQGYGNMKWVEQDQSKLGRSINRRLGLSAEEYQVKSVKSPAKIRDLYKTKEHAETGTPKKDISLPDGMTEKPKTGVRIVERGTAKNPVLPTAHAIKQLADKLAAK